MNQDHGTSAEFAKKAHPDKVMNTQITPNIFRQILDVTINKMRSLSASKGEEYKQSSTDQLANFKRGAQRQDVHPLVIWRVYFDKHLDSIMAWVKDMREGIYARSWSEPIVDRIDDAILYLILLKCFYYEQNPSKEMEFFADCPRPKTESFLIDSQADGPLTLRERIYRAISEERQHQDRKYGLITEHFHTGPHGTGPLEPRQGPGGHELGAWLVILEKELEEAKDAMVHGGNHAKGRHTVRSELIQCAAVCIAALEQHGLEG